MRDYSFFYIISQHISSIITLLVFDVDNKDLNALIMPYSML